MPFLSWTNQTRFIINFSVVMYELINKLRFLDTKLRRGEKVWKVNKEMH